MNFAVAVLVVIVGTFHLGDAQQARGGPGGLGSMGSMGSLGSLGSLGGLGGFRDRKCNYGWKFVRMMGFKDTACIWISPTKASYADAMTWCERIDGAHLVETPSMFANTMVAATAQQAMPGQKFWIGLTDYENEGVFSWYNKKRMATYTNFAPGKGPVAGARNPTKNCVFVDNKGQWHDEVCKAEYYFICQK